MPLATLILLEVFRIFVMVFQFLPVWRRFDVVILNFKYTLNIKLFFADVEHAFLLGIYYEHSPTIV